MVLRFGVIAAFIAMIVVRQYFTRERPEAPRPEHGWTIPVSVNYGKTVYVTPGEEKILRVTGEWSFVALFIISVGAFWFTKGKEAKPA